MSIYVTCAPMVPLTSYDTKRRIHLKLENCAKFILRKIKIVYPVGTFCTKSLRVSLGNPWNPDKNNVYFNILNCLEGERFGLACEIPKCQQSIVSLTILG